jgi:hypothetical protein
MFRAPKKKDKKRIVLSRDDEEDGDDDIQSSVVTLNTGRKRPRGLVPLLSFHDNSEASSKPRKRRGFKFGGATPFNNEEEEKTREEMYNAANLEALKLEQQYRSVDEPTKIDVPQEEETIFSVDDSNQEPISYISENQIDDDTLLSAEKQTKYPHTSSMDDKEIESSSAWESQILKRVGIPNDETNESRKSFEELKIHLNNTLSQLKMREEQSQNAVNRKKVELTLAEDEVRKLQSDLHATGEALEYYQGLRLSLTDYVGALRDLQTKLHPLSEAIQFAILGVDRWREWENDAMRVLQKSGLLIQVLGRQPPMEKTDDDTFHDEFGRNVKAQHVIQRESRFQQRQALKQNRTMDGYQSDTLHTPSETQEYQERLSALHSALKVALQELDDSFSSLESLLTIFEEWSKNYHEDYMNCHAGMSLADLTSVLFQVELCSTHHPLHWNDTSTSFPFVTKLHLMSKGGNNEESPLYRTLDKVLAPMFEHLLHVGAYNIHSSAQSKSMATYFKALISLPVDAKIIMDKLTNSVVHYVAKSLDDITILIVTREEPPHDDDDVVSDALEFATVIQVARIQKILSNLWLYWIPILGDQIAEVILDFCANQFLILVSSLKSPRNEFQKIWTNVSHWLDRPKFTLAASQLRAAANVYELL